VWIFGVVETHIPFLRKGAGKKTLPGFMIFFTRSLPMP